MISKRTSFGRLRRDIDKYGGQALWFKGSSVMPTKKLHVRIYLCLDTLMLHTPPRAVRKYSCIVTASARVRLGKSLSRAATVSTRITELHLSAVCSKSGGLNYHSLHYFLAVSGHSAVAARMAIIIRFSAAVFPFWFTG